MLHDPARHEPLRDEPWDAARARAAIATIVDRTAAEFVPEVGWRMHPQDEPQKPDDTNPSLYYGATGVLWALRYLREAGVAAARDEPVLSTGWLLAATQRWLAHEHAKERHSYLMGETPILMLAPAGGQEADALEQGLVALMDHPALEQMWGSPGALLAAWHLHVRTGDERWAALYRRIAARLESQLVRPDEQGRVYWVQDLYGSKLAFLDAVHGFVATAHALIAGRSLLPDWPAWSRRIAGTIAASAIREDGAATWPVIVPGSPGDRPMTKKLMQHCHGAPGFVTCLGGFPGPELDTLLLEGGEATWRAGPLAKGSNLCHGTGGNGYVFLKLFARTQDEQWLTRARAFAMHAISQFEADTERVGFTRASLWTGDPGLAVYLWDCIRAVPAFPTLDVFDA